MKYGYSKQVNLSFVDAVAKAKAALATAGFGILTEIDVKAALQQKLGVDCGNYVILGACNPPLAYRALQAEKEIGLLMPCNVVVYEDNGGSVVSAILPTVAMGMVSNPSLADIAQEGEEKLKRVIDAL